MEKKIFDHNFLSLATILYLSDSIVHLEGAVLSYRKFSLQLPQPTYTTYTTLPTYSDLPNTPLPRERCQAAGNFAARKNF